MDANLAMDTSRRRVYSSAAKGRAPRSRQMAWMDHNAFLQWQMLVDSKAEQQQQLMQQQEQRHQFQPQRRQSADARQSPSRPSFQRTASREQTGPTKAPQSPTREQPQLAFPSLPEPSYRSAPEYNKRAPITHEPPAQAELQRSESYDESPPRSRRDSTSSLDSIESWATAHAFEDRPANTRLRFAESTNKHDGQLKMMMPRRATSYNDLASAASDTSTERSYAVPASPRPPAQDMRQQMQRPPQIQVTDVPFSQWTRSAESRLIPSGGSATPALRELMSPTAPAFGDKAQLPESPRPPLRSAVSTSEIGTLRSPTRTSMDQARPASGILRNATAPAKGRTSLTLVRSMNDIAAAAAQQAPPAPEPEPIIELAEQPEEEPEEEPEPAPRKSLETSRFSRRSMEASRAPPRVSMDASRPSRISLDISKLTSRLSMDTSRPSRISLDVASRPSRISMDVASRPSHISMDGLRSRISLDVFRSKDGQSAPAAKPNRPGMPIALAAGAGTDTKSIPFRSWGPPTPSGALSPSLARQGIAPSRLSMNVERVTPRMSMNLDRSAPRLSMNLDRFRGDVAPPSRRAGAREELDSNVSSSIVDEQANAGNDSGAKRTFSLGKGLKGFLRSRTKSLTSPKASKAAAQQEPAPPVPMRPAGMSSLGTTPDFSVASTRSPMSSGLATPEMRSPRAEARGFDWKVASPAGSDVGAPTLRHHRSNADVQAWRQLAQQPSRYPQALGLSVRDSAVPHDWVNTPARGTYTRASVSGASGMVASQYYHDAHAPTPPARSPMRKMSSATDMSSAAEYYSRYTQPVSMASGSSANGSGSSMYSSDSRRGSVVDSHDVTVQGIALGGGSAASNRPGAYKGDGYYPPGSPASLRQPRTHQPRSPISPNNRYGQLSPPGSAPAQLVSLPAVQPLMIHKRNGSGSVSSSTSTGMRSSNAHQYFDSASSQSTMSSADSITSSHASTSARTARTLGAGAAASSCSTLDARKSSELLRQMGLRENQQAPRQGRQQQQQPYREDVHEDDDEDESEDEMDYDEEWH